MDALQPLRCALRSADAALLYMTRSLGFDWHEKLGWTFVRPSEGLWPDCPRPPGAFKRLSVP